MRLRVGDWDAYARRVEVRRRRACVPRITVAAEGATDIVLHVSDLHEMSCQLSHADRSLVGDNWGVVSASRSPAGLLLDLAPLSRGAISQETRWLRGDNMWSVLQSTAVSRGDSLAEAVLRRRESPEEERGRAGVLQCGLSDVELALAIAGASSRSADSVDLIFDHAADRGGEWRMRGERPDVERRAIGDEWVCEEIEAFSPKSSTALLRSSWVEWEEDGWRRWFRELPPFRLADVQGVVVEVTDVLEGQDDGKVRWSSLVRREPTWQATFERNVSECLAARVLEAECTAAPDERSPWVPLQLSAHPSIRFDARGSAASVGDDGTSGVHIAARAGQRFLAVFPELGFERPRAPFALGPMRIRELREEGSFCDLSNLSYFSVQEAGSQAQLEVRRGKVSIVASGSRIDVEDFVDVR